MNDLSKQQRPTFVRSLFPNVRTALRKSLKHWTVLLLISASIIVPSSITLLHTNAMSPIDEWMYIDYAYKLPSQGVIHKGEKIGPEALKQMSCDGLYAYGRMGPPCSDPDPDTSEYPYAGLQSADILLPPYIASVRFIGDAIHFTTGLGLVTSWRLVSVLWLVAGIVVFIALARRLRVNEIVILGVGLAYVGSPFSWWTYTYINPDSPSFFFGALLVLLAMRYTSKEISGRWLVLASTIAVATKVTNLLAVGLAVTYLVIEGIWRISQEARPYRPSWASTAPWKRLFKNNLGVAIGMAVTAVVFQLAWIMVDKALAIGSGADQGTGMPLTIPELLFQSANFLQNSINSNVDLYGGAKALPIPVGLIAPLGWLCIAGVIGALFITRGRSRDFPIVLSIAISGVFFAPMLALALTLAAGEYIPLPPRYGAPLIPGFLLAATLIIRTRLASTAILLYGGGMCISMIVLATFVA